MNWLTHITLLNIVDYFSYWVAFWTIVNIILPPREIFDGAPPHWYNTLLKFVAYYGSLNVRQFAVKLYSAVGQEPPSQAQESLKVAQTAAKEAVTAVTAAKDIVDESKPAV